VNEGAGKPATSASAGTALAFQARCRSLFAKEDALDLIVTLVVGGIIGWLAGLIMGTDHQMGVLANILIGVVGSVLGLWLAGVLGLSVAGGPARWLVSLVGAIILIGIVRALGFMRPRRMV
jgi:uncharacterized membrane protein YeaQ/YmgE (transglycosylase-associated protein family)